MILTFYDPEQGKHYRLDGSDDEIKDVFWLEELDTEGKGIEHYRRIDFASLEKEVNEFTTHFVDQKRKQDLTL